MNIAVPEAYCVESEAMADNKLYYGDNLTVLKDYVRDESVDLVYLDPPFNSRQDYNLSGKSKQIVLSVKGGNVAASQVRDLRGVLEREKAEIGVFITLEPAIKPIMKEAAEAGFYKSPAYEKPYPRLQVLTVEDLLKDATIQYPRLLDARFKQARRARGEAGESQDDLPF
jgi:hypothetical protein